MLLRNAVLTALTCAAVVLGRGGYDTAANGGMDGAKEGMQVEGSVVYLDTMDSSLILQNQAGVMDTFKLDEKMMKSDKRKALRPGTEVTVWYETKDGEKVANKVKPKGQGKPGDGAIDTATQRPSDTMMQEDGAMPDTGMGMDTMPPDTMMDTMPGGTMPQ